MPLSEEEHRKLEEMARALAVEDNPTRRRELADGLGYWAAEYLALPAERHAQIRAKPSDAIARVQMIPIEMRHCGFGAFTVKHRAARQGRNPRTGTPVPVAEKFVPFFKTGKELRDRLNDS